MAWTAPMTAADNDTFTAAQFNTNVRDNLNETEAAKITAGNQYLVVTAANAIAARVPSDAAVLTAETTTSTTYAALTTAGPAITVTTGTAAWVDFGVKCGNTVNTTGAVRAAVDITGATTSAAADAISVGSVENQSTSGRISISRGHLYTGLTAGSNTFTMLYRVTSGTGEWSNRRLSVLPL